MVYEISSWGDGEEIAPFDVDSHILAYLIKHHDLDSQFKITPNSNIFSSHSGRLPIIMMPDSSQVEGFVEIWKFIKSNADINVTFTNPKIKILYTAYIDDMIRNLNIITLYNFFVVKKNYEGYTRGSFQNYLPWPTQYKPPIDMRQFALEACLNEGIVDDESTNSETLFTEPDLEDKLQELRKEEKNLRETPVINDLQKTQIDKQLNIIAEKKSLISNMQCIKKLKDIINKYEQMSKTLMNDDDNGLFETILLVYLKCNTISGLREKFIQLWLQREHPAIFERLSQLDFDVKATKSSKIAFQEAALSLISQFV